MDMAMNQNQQRALRTLYELEAKMGRPVTMHPTLHLGLEAGEERELVDRAFARWSRHRDGLALTSKGRRVIAALA